jgi:hypothetical protein
VQVQAAINFLGESYFKFLRTKMLKKMGSRRSELSSNGRGIREKAQAHKGWGLFRVTDAEEYRQHKLELLEGTSGKVSKKKHQFITRSLGAHRSTCSPSENTSLLLFVPDASAIRSRSGPAPFYQQR